MPKRTPLQSPSRQDAVRRSPRRRRLKRGSYKEDDDNGGSSGDESSVPADAGNDRETGDDASHGEDELETASSNGEDKGEGANNDDDHDHGSENEEDASSSPSAGDPNERPLKKPKTDSGKDSTKCEFCGRKFASTYGYKYHTKNNVCRGGSIRKTQRGKRKKSESSGKSFPRFRGKEEDRTCPHCKKKFTSTLGCQYHVKKGVCLKELTKKSVAVPFATLQPGAKFITPFGVVEVVRDDRAVPLENPTDDDAKEKSAGPSRKRQRQSTTEAAKQYRAEVTRQKQQLVRLRTTVAVLGLVRRKELGRAYEAAKVNQKAIWEAQYGNDPRELDPSQRRRFPLVQAVEKEDPDFPASSFPDRIVECRWVQDKRARFLGVNEKIPPLDAPPILKDDRPNVFLQRRMLTEPFGEGVVSHTCPTCGQKFLSRTGTVYHIESKRCGQTPRAAATSDQHIQVVEDRANDLLMRRDKRRADGRPTLSSSFPVTTARKPEKPVDLRAGQAMARLKDPQSKPAANKKQDEPPRPLMLAKTMKEKKLEITADPNFVDPRKILADLEAQYRYQQSVLIGPIYPAVYDALQFEFDDPGVIKKKRKRRDDLGKKREDIRKAQEILEQEKSKLALLNSKEASPAVVSGGLAQVNNLSEAGRTPCLFSKNVASEEDLSPSQNDLSGATGTQENSRPGSGQKVVAADATAKAAAPISGTYHVAGQGNDVPDATAETAAVSNSVLPATLEQIKQMVGADEAEKLTADAKEVAKKKEPDSVYKEFLDGMRDRPPMIDTRVLVHEIDAGRYPSISRVVTKRPPKKSSNEKCPVCKTADPPMYKCTFCFRKVHIACARTKWTLPDPEPYDDFLCTVCIQSITHRRNRAERRRIEKVHGVEAAATSLNVTEMVHPPVPRHREVEKSLEYEAVVSQGRHTASLIDLESDTRTRLQREIDNTKLSGLRRQMMM